MWSFYDFALFLVVIVMTPHAIGVWAANKIASVFGWIRK